MYIIKKLTIKILRIQSIQLVQTWIHNMDVRMIHLKLKFLLFLEVIYDTSINVWWLWCYISKLLQSFKQCIVCRRNIIHTWYCIRLYLALMGFLFSSFFNVFYFRCLFCSGIYQQIGTIYSKDKYDLFRNLRINRPLIS